MSAENIPQETVMKMNEFKSYHPIVNFIYFLFVIGFSMFFMHPLCLLISTASAFFYYTILKGREVIKKIPYMLFILVFMALINPLFNHEGVTVLAYFPSGNPLTLESVLYGIAAATMIVSVIIWFSCYNEVMTSDKFIYLFGKILPSLSLILSMALRFVPKFSEQLKVVTNAQKCLGRDAKGTGFIRQIKSKVTILGIMITWALENAIETADSMKARGYGLSGRSAFSIFTFDKRDFKALLYILICGIYVLIGKFSGNIGFLYFPSLSDVSLNLQTVSFFIAYILICICPVIIEIREARRWKASDLKI